MPEVYGTAWFERWFRALSEAEQEDIIAVVDLLEQKGAGLGYPHSSAIHGSRHGGMRELRSQHAGRPYRILYAFDPRRAAVLVLGGEKTADDRWYDVAVPRAEKLLDEYLRELEG